MAASESSAKLLAESGFGSTSTRSASRNPPAGAPTPDRSCDSSSSPTITASSSTQDLKGGDIGTVAGSASGGRGEAYVNQGLVNFERKRALWLAGGAGAGGLIGGSGGAVVGGGSGGKSSGEVRARIVDVEDVVDKIFSQTGSGQLSHPLPLGQMIDILVEFWEADGLYD